jgi:serine protease Do
VAGLLAVAAVGCAASVGRSKDAVIQRILPCSVQVAAERGGNRVRAGSGVVVHAESTPPSSLVLITQHTVKGLDDVELYVAPGGRSRQRRAAVVVAVSPEADLALLRVDGLALPAATVGSEGQLGADVWVVAYPWGRRLSVVSGVVSQVEPPGDDELARGATIMIDASVSYGASGGGVFEATTGLLIGVVEGYRTARMNVRGDPKLAVDFPVPGETNVVPARAIRRFLEASGYGSVLHH